MGRHTYRNEVKIHYSLMYMYIHVHVHIHTYRCTYTQADMHTYIIQKYTLSHIHIHRGIHMHTGA